MGSVLGVIVIIVIETLVLLVHPEASRAVLRLGVQEEIVDFNK